MLVKLDADAGSAEKAMREPVPSMPSATPTARRLLVPDLLSVIVSSFDARRRAHSPLIGSGARVLRLCRWIVRVCTQPPILSFWG